MAFFDFLGKSDFSEARKEMKANNLIPQAALLKQFRNNNYVIPSKDKLLHIELARLHGLGLDGNAALSSARRFIKAQEICLKHNLHDAAKSFDFYVNLYKFYCVHFTCNPYCEKCRSYKK